MIPTLMFWRLLASSKGLSGVVCTTLLFGICCRDIDEEAIIEDFREGERLTDYRMTSLTGIRDGDLLPVRIVFEAPFSNLRMDLLFRIDFPTRLESGQYHWERLDTALQGSVRASSVTFLGGQSDNPNLGGVFRLLSATGDPMFKVTLPTSEVKRPNSGIPLAIPSH